MKTCLNRKNGMCQVEIYPKKCERDYINHPNNSNCSKYYEINIFEFEVKEGNGRNIGKIFSEVFKQDSPMGELLRKL